MTKQINIVEQYKYYLIHNLGRADNTAKSYICDISGFVNEFPNYKEMQKRDIVNYLASLNGKFSASTINRKTASIQSFWNFLITMGETEQNITEGLPRPKIRKQVVVCPEKDEVQTMIRNSQNETFKLAVKLGAYVGLRASESINLKIENIDFESGVAILEDTKTGLTEEVAIDRKTRDDIKSYCLKCGINKGEVLRTKFGKAFGERTFSRFIEENSDINYHQFRKFCASSLANSDAGIHVAKNQLRHSSLLTTLRYVRVDLNHQCNELDKMREE